MLNISSTAPNSFNGLNPLDNRKQRVESLLNIKREAEQMAAAGADPGAVKEMIGQRKKDVANNFPDENTYKKSVNASQKFKEIGGDSFDGSSQSAPGTEAEGGFNPGFGMGGGAGGVAPMQRGENSPQARELNELYKQSGFESGPTPEGANDPGAVMSMLPHNR